MQLPFFTKQFFGWVSILFLLSACQQQLVPEISYDLDAKSLSGNTRDMQLHRILLYQNKEVLSTELSQEFEGYITSILPQENGDYHVYLTNIMGIDFEFSADLVLGKKLEKDMHLIVHYTQTNGKQQIIDVRKED